eukprot:COSAG04_NODE_1371_length_7040_cov_8.745714_4_plen_615_part_00
MPPPWAQRKRRKKPAVLVSTAKDAVLRKQYDKKRQTQKAFVAAALAADGSLWPKEVEDYWRWRHIEAADVVPSRGKPRRKKAYLRELSDEQRALLSRVFYQQFKGSIGVWALYEAIRGTDEQKAALADSGGEQGFVTWRDVRAWYNAQEVAQLTRPAKKKSKSAAKVFSAQQMAPYVTMGIDSIVMFRPGSSRAESLQSEGHNAIVQLVDYFSRYSWLVAVRRLTAKEVGAGIVEVVWSIRDKYGGWPTTKTVILHDNGGEFGEAMRRAVTAEEPTISFRANPTNEPNAAAVVENANRVTRGVMRRLLKAKAVTEGGDDRPDARWYGKDGATLAEINSVQNSRPVLELAYASPADVMEVALAEEPTEEQQALLAKAREATLSTAKKRHSATIVRALKLGDRVRLIDASYVKSVGQRSNVQKQGARWSKELYTVRRVLSTPGAPPMYTLEDKGSQQYAHSQLQHVKAVEKPQRYSSAIGKDREVAVDKETDGKVWRRGFALPERRDAAGHIGAVPRSDVAPRRPQRSAHPLEGASIEVQWLKDTRGELVPATAENVEDYGDDETVYFDVEVRKVRARDVEVYYAADDAVWRHNLLEAGNADKYMEEGERWRRKAA